MPYPVSTKLPNFQRAATADKTDRPPSLLKRAGMFYPRYSARKKNTNTRLATMVEPSCKKGNAAVKRHEGSEERRQRRERDAFAAVKPLRKKATHDPTTTQVEKGC